MSYVKINAEGRVWFVTSCKRTPGVIIFPLADDPFDYVMVGGIWVHLPE